jgi:hypothetical protein
MALLKAMTDYMAQQETVELTFDTALEVVTPELEKVMFTNSGQMLLSRPDKLRASRLGGYADVEMVFDGKTLSLLGKNLNVYTQLDAPGTVAELIENLRGTHGLALPGADLLGSYEDLVADVLEAKHIGHGVIDGLECEHLAFRNHDVDWQLWVAVGERPFPCQYVITSKMLAQAPQYVLRIKSWRTDVQPDADAFEYTPPVGAAMVDPNVRGELDELPPGALPGATE